MLVYDQPIGQTKPSDRQAASRTPAGFSVLELTRLLWRRRIAIAAAALIGACAAVSFGKGPIPKYTSTAHPFYHTHAFHLVAPATTSPSPDTCRHPKVA